MKLRTTSSALLVAGALVLTGCSADPGAEASDSDALTIVASTNVYADIATTVAGDDVTVTAIITSGAQDPHEYEASAQNRVTVAGADLVVRNGGGYDAFIDALVSDGTPTVTAADLAPDAPHDEGDDHGNDHDHAEGDGHDHAEGDGHGHIAGFNEHVWYDPEIMSTLAQHIAEELATLDPAHASGYAERSAAFQADMSGLTSRLDAIAAAHTDDGVFVTEPVGLRLLERAGLHNETPAAFTEAVEEGQDVPAKTLLEAIDILTSGSVQLVAVNAQTGGAETERVIAEAKKAGLPTIELSEMLPEGDTYVIWMGAVIDEVSGALA